MAHVESDVLALVSSEPAIFAGTHTEAIISKQTKHVKVVGINKLPKVPKATPALQKGQKSLLSFLSPRAHFAAEIETPRPVSEPIAADFRPMTPPAPFELDVFDMLPDEISEFSGIGF